jgi:hypothetical protein
MGIFSKKLSCCDPKKESCWISDIHKANKHSRLRADVTGKFQSMIWDASKSAWKITTVR